MGKLRKVSDLITNDYIVFGFDYNGGEPTEIMVAPITNKHRNGFITHFLYGHSFELRWLRRGFLELRA